MTDYIEYTKADALAERDILVKKLMAALIVVFLLGSIFIVCGIRNNTAEPSSASVPADSDTTEMPVSVALSSSVPPESSSCIPAIAVGKNPYPGQTGMGGKSLSLAMYSPDPETEPPAITLSTRQQNSIARDLQAIMEKYESGEYPLEKPGDDDSAGFYPGWPKGIGYPVTISLRQLVFSTVGHKEVPMSVQVPLAKGWFMECALAIQAESGTDTDYSSGDNHWIPVAAHFIGPSGLVYDAPGETSLEEGSVIVIS